MSGSFEELSSATDTRYTIFGVVLVHIRKAQVTRVNGKFPAANDEGDNGPSLAWDDP